MPPLPIDIARQLVNAADELGATTIELHPVKSQEKPQEKPLPEGPWTVKQAAKALGVSERTVRDLVSTGKLKSHKVGAGRGVVRILVEDVEEFRRTNATAEKSPKKPKPEFRHRRSPS
jgi:excisionase family DNA binding protein